MMTYKHFSSTDQFANKLVKIIFLILLFALTNNFSYSQYYDLGSWNVTNIKYNLDEKLSMFGEVQLRSLKFYNHFHYHEYKGGLNYKIYPNVLLTVAAGDYDTYKEHGNFVLPRNNDEFRLWPQIVLNQSIWKLKIEQRYRAEFRFTSNGYRNRFRYRFGISFPFGNDETGFKPYQISGSNELFFTDKATYFERNRMLLAFHYKVSQTTTFQVGYLHQFDYKINDETGRDFLQLGIFFEFFSDQIVRRTDDIDVKDN